MPQPPWIGSDYFKQRTRILLIALNPGSKSSGDYKLERKRLLQKFKGGDSQALRDYFSSPGTIGNAKLLAMLSSTGLSLSNIAVANVALCATESNKYPRHFLKTCFSVHTSRWLKELKPTGVISMGNEAHRFKEQIDTALLPVRVSQYPALHFSSRFSNPRKQEDYRAIRNWLKELSDTAPTTS